MRRRGSRGSRWWTLGEHRLKDLDRPVRLFQLAAAGLEAPSLLAGRRHAAGDRGGPGAGGGAAVVHGLPAALTSFVGRGGPVREVAGLLAEHRLVTVTGPGGSGKTRLAGEVARRVAARFADGAWLVELAPVADPGQVAAVVAAALGVREQPGLPAAEALARVLARQQLLLVLDNCEHVIAAAAGLCAELVAACDDLRVLATSREPLRVGGEARYRLGPLAVPDPDDLADAAKAEAVVLFADRARQADAHFVAGRPDRAGRWRGWWRGWTGCRWRSSWPRPGPRRWAWAGCWTGWRTGSRCWPAGTGWRRPGSGPWPRPWSGATSCSDDDERRAFRAVSVFPGPFTLEGAEAVAGADAGLAVLRLVDCSLLVPPRTGADGRSAVCDAGDVARLRGEAAGRGRRAGHGSRRAGRVRAAGGGGGFGRVADQRRGGGRGPAAGCRGPRHAPGAGLGRGP